MIHKTTFKPYIIGFASSLLLTTLAFVLAAKHVDTGGMFLSRSSIIYALLGLAFVQFVVQLVFFLHLGIRKEQQLNLALFISTISVVLVIIIGSIWIMNNLNYNMSPQEETHYMYEQG